MRPGWLSGPLAALACVCAARAEEPGAGEPARPAYDEEIIVYGVRPAPLDPAPGASTDVLHVDDFELENKDLAELLSQAEGVYVRRFGAAGDRSELSIRGSSPTQVAVAIDGVRANSVLTGGFDLSRACLPLFERIEITRGAGSTDQGSGAIGGVVNLVSRAAEPGRTTRLAASAGSFDTFEGSALHAGWWGDLDYTIGYCGLGTEGDFEFARPTFESDGLETSFDPDTATRLNNDRVRHGGTLGVGAPLLGGTLRLSDHAVFSEGGEPGPDAGDGETAGQALEARSRDWSNLAQLRWEGLSPSGLGGDLELGLHHRYEWRRFRDPLGTARLPIEPVDERTELQTAGAHVADAWVARPWGQDSELALRGEVSHDRLDSSAQPARRRTRAAGGLDETLRLLDERVTLSAALRADWTEGFGVAWLPELGLVLSPRPWLRVRGHLGRAWRVPSFDELYHPDEGSIRGNEDLDPEDAWNADVGLELRLAALGPLSDVTLRGSVFRREIDETIVWVRINDRTLAPVNTGPAVSEGWEVSVSLALTRFLRLSGNHTELRSRRDANDGRLPGQPEREAFGRVELGPPGVWKLVGEVHHVGDQLASENGSLRLPERTVWNASAALDLARVPGLPVGRWLGELWVFAEWDNLGDRAVRDALTFPQPGRTLTVGLEGRW